MKHTWYSRPADLAVWAAATLFLFASLTRSADAVPADDLKVLRDECGSCHVAYPAQLLPAADWGQVLGRLDDHFGVDASLDEASVAAVARALHVSPAAATRVARSAALPRITTSDGFRREHDEVRADVWRRSAVKSAANCDACHRGAATGDFDEDKIRMPL